MEILRTPFHGNHVDAGARMVPFSGWELPIHYTGFREEHLSVRKTAGLFDVSHMGEIRVRGEGAEDCLQWLLSNGIRRIQQGQAQYNVMCNERGGVVDDVVVYRMDKNDFLVCVNAANIQKDFAWMQTHNPCPQKAQITDESKSWAQVAIQGPKAAEILQQTTDIDLSKMGTYWFSQGTVCGIEHCVLARTGYTGEDGFEVFLPIQTASGIWSRLLEVGQGSGIVPVGLAARDTLRLEASYCLYGHELSDDLSPLQAGLGWVTKLQKPGGFLGASAIRERQSLDRETLVSLVIEGKRIARQDSPVMFNGNKVGWVTSGTMSPTLEQSICLAYVDRDFCDLGSRVVIDLRGREVTAVVVNKPFYKRSA